MRSQGYGDSSGKPGKRGWRELLFRPFLSPRFYFLVALGLSTTAVGCTRKFFRERADIDALAMIHEKDRDPRWKIDNYYVYPDPRARFADWSDPDRPPMPPDDPASVALAPVPQRPGKPGVAYVVGKDYLEVLAAWDAENRAHAASETASLGTASGIQTTENQASQAA